MPDIIDQYHGDPLLTRLYAALDDRPRALDAVKTASFDPELATALPDRAFAWDGERRFPIHTREDTIASVVYRSKYAGAVPGFVDEALNDAVEAYGIDPTLFTSTSPAVKVAAAPVEYALPALERLPLGDAEQVKVAEQVLLRDSAILPLDERVLAFAKVASAAASAGVALHPDVGAYAGLNACNTQMLRDRIGARAATTKVAECQAAYDALDTALAGMPPLLNDRETLLKLAARLEDLDQVSGVAAHYGRKIFDPMKTVFNAGEKVANDGGAQALMQLPRDVWEQVDAPEMADLAERGDVATFMQAYETLPMDIKMVLKRQFGG